MALGAKSPVVRPCSPADEDGLHALWSSAFDAPLMTPTWSLDPLRHEHTLLAVEPDGTVAASVVGLPRRVRGLDGAVHHVLGVANVATLPTARGKGYARLLLADLLSRGAQDGYDWALLFTGTPGVYAGSGWTSFTQQHRTGTLRAHPRTTAARLPAPEHVSLDRLGSTPQTWRALAPLHDAATAGHPLSTVRDDLDLRRTALWHAGSTLLVAEEAAQGGTRRPVGYVVVDTGETARVVELAAESEELVETLLRAAAGHAWDEGHRRLTLRLPESPLLARLSASLLGDLGWAQDLTGMTFPLGASQAATRAVVEHPLAHHSTGDYL